MFDFDEIVNLLVDRTNRTELSVPERNNQQMNDESFKQTYCFISVKNTQIFPFSSENEHVAQFFFLPIAHVAHIIELKIEILDNKQHNNLWYKFFM